MSTEVYKNKIFIHTTHIFKELWKILNISSSLDFISYYMKFLSLQNVENQVVNSTGYFPEHEDISILGHFV